jgi:hypothetical protein
MRITGELLNKHHACPQQVKAFSEIWPDGVQPAVENMVEADKKGLTVLWCSFLLPAEGIISQRAFAWWCAEQVKDCITDPLLIEAVSYPFALLLQRINSISSVSTEVLRRAVCCVASYEGDYWTEAQLFALKALCGALDPFICNEYGAPFVAKYALHAVYIGPAKSIGERMDRVNKMRVSQFEKLSEMLLALK